MSIKAMVEKSNGYELDVVAIGIDLVAEQLQLYGIDTSKLTTYGVLVQAAQLLDNDCQELSELKDDNIHVYKQPPPPRPFTPAQKIEIWKADHQKYYRSSWWMRRRRAAIQDAGFKCHKCDINTYELQVHHLTYERIGEELPEDLQVLCSICHSKFHAQPDSIIAKKE